MYAKNFISFKETNIIIKQNVATMIFGENHDSEKQKNNGSGKSSVVEAISFGLTGEPLRKVKTEEVINDSADYAEVRVELDNDSDKKRFTISRRIFRDKTPQQIVCKQYDADGVETNMENTIQPTVIDYNRFILDELGLTKDDLYNNYILCRNKYSSFFEASDKEKKEIINRFSNGDKVDGSIDALDIDIVKADTELSAARMAESKINGQIEAVNDQIEREENKMGQFEESKVGKIAEIEQKIGEKNAYISETRSKIRLANERLVLIRDLNDRMGELENSEKTLVECYHEIKKDFSECAMQPISDYDAKSAEYADRISEQHNLIAEHNANIEAKNVELKKLNDECLKISHRLSALEIDDERETTSENNEIAKIEAEIDEAMRQIAESRIELDNCSKSLSEHKSKLAHLEAMIKGAVTCPSCGHQFLLNDNISKTDAERAADDCRKDIDLICDRGNKIQAVINSATELRNGHTEQINRIRSLADSRNEILRGVRNSLSNIELQISTANSFIVAQTNSIKMCEDVINSYEAQMNGGIRRSMFDEVFDTIDGAFSKGKAYVKQCEEMIESAKSSVEVFEKSIEDIKNSKPGDIIETLESSKKVYLENLRKAKNDVEEKMAVYNELQNQKNLFVEFKTHLANTKIDAISKITNKLLEDIGSDIRINLQGFKVLKTGKIREKITVQVLRNGVDCGSFEKMSAGERARICLANIIAMQALINSNANDDGKGLDFMAIDEIMDVSDEIGLMSYCETINKLGITVLMITQGLVSESYPYRLIVTKENGISKISI